MFLLAVVTSATEPKFDFPELEGGCSSPIWVGIRLVLLVFVELSAAALLSRSDSLL